MRELASRQQFEQALALRDEIAALEYLQEKQNMERQKKHNEDILNYIVRDDTVYLMNGCVEAGNCTLHLQPSRGSHNVSMFSL